MKKLDELKLSGDDNLISGVCGGLGEFTGIPSWLWRLLFVASVMFFGMGLIPYILLWVFMPEEYD